MPGINREKNKQDVKIKDACIQTTVKSIIAVNTLPQQKTTQYF